MTIARLAEDFIGFGRFQRCLLIIAGLGFMADAIEVGAAHGKGGKGEEPGLITSAQEVPLGIHSSFLQTQGFRDIKYYNMLTVTQ